MTRAHPSEAPVQYGALRAGVDHDLPRDQVLPPATSHPFHEPPGV